MWMPFVAAFVVGALAPFVRALAWNVPLPMLSWKQSLRTTLGAGITTVFASLIALIAFPPLHASALGVVLGTVLMLSSARRRRHERGTVLLAYRLRQDAYRDEALRALSKRFVSYAKRAKPNYYAHLASIAVLPMSAMGAWEDALKILQGIELLSLEGDARARHGQALATCLMALGKLEDAEDVLAQLDRPATDALERWLVALDALLLAIQGASEKALALAKLHDEGEGALAASYAIVRAHAYACEGKDKKAKKSLRRAVDIAGHDALMRANRPVGPATDLAREMLVDAGYGERI